MRSHSASEKPGDLLVTRVPAALAQSFASSVSLEKSLTERVTALRSVIPLIYSCVTHIYYSVTRCRHSFSAVYFFDVETNERSDMIAGNIEFHALIESRILTMAYRLAFINR